MVDKRTDRGFTLVELLVVIAIIGVLVALLLPAVQAAREAARRMSCGNNLKQVGLALQNYHSSRRSFPPGNISEGGIGTQHYTTWTIEILPYMELQAVYDLFKENQDPSVSGSQFLENPIHEKFQQTLLPVMVCPSDINIDQLAQPQSGPGFDLLWAPGSYRAMSGRSSGQSGAHYWDNPEVADVSELQMPDAWRGAMHATRKAGGRRNLGVESIKNILDGTSNTLMVGEYHTITKNEPTESRRTFWAYGYTSYNQSSSFLESRTLLADYERCTSIGGGGVHTCKRGWGSLHAGGSIQFLSCDGSVKNIQSDIDVVLFVNLSTIDGGEVGAQVVNLNGGPQGPVR